MGPASTRGKRAFGELRGRRLRRGAYVQLVENPFKNGPFVLIWRTLYDRYAPSSDAIDNNGYPYRVRIFDRILWLIGEPVYGFSKSPGS